MTAATETGHIVAYLSLDDTEWARSIRRAIADLDRLRSQGDVDLRLRVDDNGAAAQLAAIRAELDALRRRSRTDIQFRTNARQTGSDIRGIGRDADAAGGRVNFLRDAILLMGAGAVPAAAVAGGAIAGLLPVAVSTALGIAGISDQIKTGAIQTGQYAGDVSALSVELTKLKGITAGGLLDGLHTAMADADPLFKTINTDAHIMSTQVGQIAANTVPALASVLTQLNPLFETFGNELVDGSARLQNWAKSSNGIHEFVAYVQSELPTVEHVLGSIAGAVVHIGESLGPLGHITLSTLGVLADVIDAIPLPVLQALLPLLVGVRVSMLAFRGAAAVMGLMSAAYVRTAGTAQKFGLSSMLGHMQARTAALTDAAAQDAAAATTARANYNAARASGTASASQIRSLGATAVAAEGAAAKSGAAAEANAVRTLAAGRMSAAGWAAALGPIGALMVGLTLLGLTFMDTGSDTADATATQNAYTESVKQSTDALSAANAESTARALADRGVAAKLTELRSEYTDLGISNDDLARSAIGPKKAYDALIAQMNAFSNQHKNSKGEWDETGQKMNEVAGGVAQLRLEYMAAKDTQDAYNKMMAQSYAAQLGITGSVTENAAALGMNEDAYVAAASAAQQDITQRQAQTQALRVQNDAMQLLSDAFDELNGKTLDVSDARINFASSLASLSEGLKKDADAWKLNTDAGRQNQQNVNAAIRSAQALGKAVSGGSKMTREGAAATKEALTQERARLVAAGASTGAIKRVDQALRGLNSIDLKAISTQIDTTSAQAKIADLTAKINAIKQGKVPHLNAESGPGKKVITTLQAQIDALRQNHVPEVDALTGKAKTALAEVQAYIDGLHGKRVNVDVVTRNRHDSYSGADSSQHGKGPIAKRQGGLIRRAAGGDVGMVVGPGTGTSDQVPAVMVDGSARQPYMLSNGEWIATAEATKKNRGPLAAANRGATLAVVHEMATGGPVGKIVKGGGAGKAATYKYRGTTYDTLKQAEDARKGDIKAEIKLIATIDGSGLRAFDAAVKKTAADGRSAFRDLYADMKKAGASDGLLKNVRSINTALDKTLRHRDTLRAQLGTPTNNTKTAYEKLEQIQSDRKSMRDSVTSTGRGVFDVSESRGYDDTAPTGASMQANAVQAANLIARFYAGIRKLATTSLGKSQTGRGMLQQIIEKGPGAYPQVQALLKDTPADLTRLIGTQARINTASAGLGTFAGTTFYGADEGKAKNAVTKLRNDIAADDRKADRQGDRIGARVAHALANLKQDIYLDGKKVGSGVRTGNKKNDRRN